MLKKYIKDIVETEVIRLYDDFNKYKTLVPQLNDVIHQRNSELSNSYNTISSLKESIENLEGKLISKSNLLSEQKEENEKLKSENEKLEESIKNLGGTVSLKDILLNEKNKEIEELKEENKQLKDYRALDFKASLYTGYKLEDLKQENEQLKKENEMLKNSYNFINNNTLPDLESKVTSKERIATEINLVLNKEKRKAEELEQENEKLKKELLDSKNGLNGANYVIKNNKEWINSQDKKIKELEEEVRCLKSDKEDLQYNIRRKSTQKIQLETKNKCLEDKFKRIYKTIEENYYQDGYYELLRIKNIISEIIKES